jgi:DNA primase
VCTPLTWDELAATNPDAFTIADVDRLLDREDSFMKLAIALGEAQHFAANIDTAFGASGLVLEAFDRFGS